MPSIITAGTTTGTALSLTSDTSGELQIRTNNGSTTALTLTTGGNINIPTTGARITGDFSNATVASRVAFQSNTGTFTSVPVYGPGASQSASIDLILGNDATNTSRFHLLSSTVDARLSAGIYGTGTYVPMTFFTGGSERMRIDTSGNVGIGTSTTTNRFAVVGGTSAFFSSSTSAIALGSQTGVSAVFKNNASSIGGGYGLAVNVIGTGLSSLQSMSFDAATAYDLALQPAGGNVGIGTSSPTYPLTVGNNRQIGGLNSSGAGVTFAIVNGSNNLVFGDDSVNTGQLTIQSRSNMVFSLNTAERARITSGGQLLVGASSARDANIIGIQNGDGFVERDFLDSGGTSRTIVVSGEFNYWFEITVMCIGNSNNSQIGEGRWIAGRRDYGGAAHIFSNSSLVNTCIAFSTSQSIVGNLCTYTITVTNTQDGANKHWLTKVRLVNSNSFSLS
jgi:hypothetical protein